MESSDERRTVSQGLYALIANEADPQRLMSLIDQLLNEFDARRRAIAQPMPPESTK